MKALGIFALKYWSIDSMSFNMLRRSRWAIVGFYFFFFLSISVASALALYTFYYVYYVPVVYISQPLYMDFRYDHFAR
jgi:hypothetical protein